MALDTSGLAPSGSTNATGIAGAITSLLIYGLSLKGINFPAGMEAAIAVLVATLVGYLPASGRKVSAPLDSTTEKPK